MATTRPRIAETSNNSPSWVASWIGFDSSAIALLIACVMAVNTYSYSMVSAIPLIQSDAWRYLDGFLGRFIEHGFSLIDLFAQTNQGETNLPLQKLFLFFHTRYYGMDFRLEGLLGTICGIGLVAVLARAAAGGGFRRWGEREAWLLAGLALILLSLNSTNVYTWPLATLWFMPILIAAAYGWFIYAHEDARLTIALLTFILGLLLDEVAFPVFASVLGSLVVAYRCRGPGQLARVAVYGAAGLAASRMTYWLLGVFGPHYPSILTPTPPLSFAVLLDPDIWKAAIFSLSDSVVHQSNQSALFGRPVPWFEGVAGTLLLGTHVWFWWRVIGIRDRSPEHQFSLITLLAGAMMLLFYGLVFGIVLQRVPDFGFDYLHQPRYVLFYELNLAAIAMMLYRDFRYRPLQVAAVGPLRRATSFMIVVAILLFGGLQERLSTLAWAQDKYLSAYLEGVALSMGRLAAHPDAQMQCADIMTICQYPPAKRRELIGRLVHYRLNIFSPDFQAFHRLHPYPITVPQGADVQATAH